MRTSFETNPLKADEEKTRDFSETDEVAVSVCVEVKGQAFNIVIHGVIIWLSVGRNCFVW